MSGKRLVILASVACTIAIWSLHAIYETMVLRHGSLGENLISDLGTPEGLIALMILAICLTVGYVTAVAQNLRVETLTQTQLTRRNRELEALQSIAIAVGRTRDTKEIFDIVLSKLKALIPYDSASIALLENGELILEAGVGYPMELTWRENAEKLLKAPHWKALLSQNKPHIIPDSREDEHWITFTGLEYIRCWLGVPIIFQGKVSGVLFVDHSLPHFFNDNHAQFALAVAQQAAAALENARLYRDLEKRVEQRTAELNTEKERNETIVQNVADAIIFTDPKGDILYVNPAWEQLTGYSLQEAVGQNPRFLQSGETDRSLYEEMWATILDGQLWQGYLRNKRRDGTLYDAEMKTAPVLDGEGNIQFFVAVQRDVTDARQLEALKTRFIADAAHDLGNPVGVLQFQLELFRLEPHRQAEHLNVIEHQVERLDHLVKDLLTLSRIDRGVLPTDMQLTNIDHLIKRVVVGQQPIANQRQINLEFGHEKELPWIEIDSHQIERTITNLINNALNYTPDGGTIWINTGLGDGTVSLTIKDTGMGIPPDELPHIFDRFFRGKHAQTYRDGTGLGLAITHEIINNHGGKIEVNSSVGEGTSFIVSLPVAPSPQPDSSTASILENP